MSTPTDVNNSLFEVYVFLQDVMKQHEIIDSALKDLTVCEENQDFTPLETASAAIIDACNKIEKRRILTTGPPSDYLPASGMYISKCWTYDMVYISIWIVDMLIYPQIDLDLGHSCFIKYPFWQLNIAYGYLSI